MDEYLREIDHWCRAQGSSEVTYMYIEKRGWFVTSAENGKKLLLSMILSKSVEVELIISTVAFNICPII
jgi:hypothetical protein